MIYKQYDGGVYAIYSPDNICLYVGATENFIKRYSHHLYLLKCKKHNNWHLQDISNKIGIDNLFFTPIFACAAKDIFINEKKFQKILNPVCNNLPDLKFIEVQNDKSIVFNLLRDKFLSKWITVEEAKRAIDESNILNYGISLKAVGQVLKYFGQESKRVGIKRLLMYYIK